MIKQIERIAYTLILGVCMVASGILIHRQFSRPENKIESAEKRLLGRVLNVPGISWSESSKTVVLAVATTCTFCEQSLPLYRQLAEKHAPGTKIVVLAPEPREVVSAYLAGHGIFGVTIATLNLKAFGIPGTPTILVVNPVGQVERAFVGKLAESRVLALLRLTLE